LSFALRLGRVVSYALAAGALGGACANPCHCRTIAAVAPAETARPIYRQIVPHGDATLALIGDVQRTSFEGCVLGNEVNDAEQQLLLADLGAQRPGATVFLGDLVFQGDSPAHWAYFDGLLQSSGLAERSLFALPGNHEYFLSGNTRELGLRFPRLRRRTYDAFTWGSVRVLLFDANAQHLTRAEWRSELAWLDAELEQANAGAVRGVLLLTHQAPFTQSSRVSGDEHLLRDVVPRFCRSEKKLLFVSAHAHGYERFSDVDVAGCREARTPFVVSAGGGGPRPPERRAGAEHDAVDVSRWPPGHDFRDWPRPFNYLLLVQNGERVHVEVHVLAKGESSVVVAETLELPFAAEPRPSVP